MSQHNAMAGASVESGRADQVIWNPLPAHFGSETPGSSSATQPVAPASSRQPTAGDAACDAVCNSAADEDTMSDPAADRWASLLQAADQGYNACH